MANGFVGRSGPPGAVPTGLSALPGLAARRRTLARLLNARPLLERPSAAFDLACLAWHRELDAYTVALEEAGAAPFVELSAHLMSIPDGDADRPWLNAAGGDWLVGATATRRRMVLMDQEANRQLLNPVARGDDHGASHPADG